MLKTAYDVYRSHGFVMSATETGQKFSTKKGAYTERANEPFSDTAMGYACIVPKTIIIVDNDAYKDDGEGFNLFLLDMGYSKGDIVPFAITPSGGEHYAFVNKYPTKIIGDKNGVGKRYPFLDVFTGYQSVIPCVGTESFSKFLNKMGTYKWADDNFEEDIILNKWNDKFLTLFNMRERVEKMIDDNEVDDLDIAIKEAAMPDLEVERMINLIPNKIADYDGVYMPMGMALNHRYLHDSNRGLELFQKFCSKLGADNNPSQNESKWLAGHFKGNQITYKRIAKLYKTLYFTEQIELAESGDDLEVICSEIKTIENMTVDKLDMRKEYAAKINLKYKKLKKDEKFNERVPQIKSILLNMTPEVIKKHDIIETELQVYLHSNNYVMKYGNDLLRDLTKTSVNSHLVSFGIQTKEERDALIYQALPIRNVLTIPDYTTNEKVIITLDKLEMSNMFNLTQRLNPLLDMESNFEEDEDIIQEFMQGVWAGKINDIVKLIALSIKYGESKLNRLMLVAPSDAGKTELASILKFQKITMKRLLNGMRGDKGVGGGVLEGIKSTGLLLIDEANTALEQEIKDMDKTLYIDQFGSGGTQIIPLFFTVLTSTHKTATRNNSDELYNRFLQVELLESEMSHTIRQGKYYGIDKERYSKVIESYIRNLFKDTIQGESSRDELSILQSKYRLPSNNDLDEVLFDISEKVIKDIKSKIREGIHSDYLLRKGVYYTKRKKDISDIINDLLSEVSGLDQGKYSEKLMPHFIGHERISIKINNINQHYYRLNLTPFGMNEEDEIINQFDNLNLQDLVDLEEL